MRIQPTTVASLSNPLHLQMYSVIDVPYELSPQDFDIYVTHYEINEVAMIQEPLKGYDYISRKKDSLRENRNIGN